MNICKWTFLGAFAVACSSFAFGGNIVLNGGFETGDFTDWTTNVSSSFPWAVDTGAANSGTYYAETGCQGASCITADTNTAGAWLYQDLAAAPGTLYDLTFFYFPGDSGEGTGTESDIELQVLWGDSATPLVASASGTCDTANTNCVFDTNAAFSSTYVEYTIPNLLATSSSTRLEFLGEESPDFNGLDDISVQASTATPEPAAFLLMGTGLLGLGLFRRRRRK